MATGWRIEVTHAGKRYQWRKGSGKERQSRKGGRFNTLEIERQAVYEKNRQSKSRSGARNIAAKSGRMPAGRH
jgi:hypothetical protein